MIYAIGLGSNLNSRYGTQYQTLKKTINFIKKKNIQVLKTSRVYITQPVGMKGNNWFLNAAILVLTQLNPDNLLLGLKRIENEMGRNVDRPNTARPCDLDILLTNQNTILNNKQNKYNITIPHKELHKRMFVLKPLMDICPQWNHPILDLNIKKIISSSESSEKIRIYRNIL